MSAARERTPTQSQAAPAELAELDRLLSSPVERDMCGRLVELATRFPGRLRQAITALSQAHHGPALDALQSFPPTTPGVLEGLYHGIRNGIAREIDGRPAPEQLAVEFRHSRAKAFPSLLAHADAAFPEQMERLEIAGKRWYRLTIWAEAGRRRLRLLLDERGSDLAYLHGRLARLRHARLWLNGWSFEGDGPWTAPHQVHLVQAWIDHASRPPAS